MKMSKFNVMIILFFAISISLLNKNSHEKSITLDNGEENEFEQPRLRFLDPEEDQPYRSYHKSSGGLSTGGIIAIVICALIVLLAALALALLCRRAATGAVVAEVIPEYSVKTPHYNIDTPGSAVVTKVL